MDQKINVDFHTHLYTSWPDVRYEPGPRDLTTITRVFLDRGLGAGTITSFNDYRFDSLMKTGKDIPESWAVRDFDSGCIVTTDKGEEFYWFNSNEVPTKQGHILMIGNKREKQHIKPYRNLGETIQQAREEAVFLIADHPLMVLRDKRSSGIGKELLLKHKNDFSAAELNGNCVFPLLDQVNQDTMQLCIEHDIPLVANSDAYGFANPFFCSKGLPFANVGRSFNAFFRSGIDFTDMNSFLNSLKNSIETKGPIIHSQQNKFLSVANHAVLGLFYRFGKQIDFLNIQHHGDRED